MRRLTVIIGGLLVAVGIVAYVASSAVSVTALIPAFVGALLLLCAAVAVKPRLRQGGLLGAGVIALLGAAGTLTNVIKIGHLFTGSAERPSAIITSTIMFVMLLFYLAVATRSYIASRRSAARPQRH